MPPKPKRNREEVMDAAINILRKDGYESITARNLAQELSVAPSSVFTHFSSKDELEGAILERIRNIYGEYLAQGAKLNPPFKGCAVKFLEFAKNEPNMYRLIFMRKNTDRELSELIFTESYRKEILDSAIKSFGIDEKQAVWLYDNLWAYIHGMATLIVTGACSFSDEEICSRLGTICRGMLLLLKMPKDDRTDILPQNGDESLGDINSYISKTGEDK